HGDIDIAELMQGPPSQVAQRYAAATSDGSHADHEHEHRHAPADSCVLDATGSVSRRDLERFFAEVPEDLWRGKGFLLVDDAPKLVQFAMGELEISDAEPRDRYYLVLIGHALDRAELTARFAALAAAGEAA
ncbi:MAG: GTP-binding protein, partial [Methyloligellaceae bacterium]